MEIVTLKNPFKERAMQREFRRAIFSSCFYMQKKANISKFIKINGFAIGMEINKIKRNCYPICIYVYWNGRPWFARFHVMRTKKKKRTTQANWFDVKHIWHYLLLKFNCTIRLRILVDACIFVFFAGLSMRLIDPSISNKSLNGGSVCLFGFFLYKYLKSLFDQVFDFLF